MFDHIVKKKEAIEKHIKDQMTKSEYDDCIMKGIKGETGLEKKIIEDKNGKMTTVYVRVHPETGEKHEFAEGHKVDFEHKGKKMTGTITKLTHHPVTSKFGFADLKVEGDKSGFKYGKSLRAIEHHKEGGQEVITKTVKKVEKPKGESMVGDNLSNETPEVQARGEVIKKLFDKITDGGKDLTDWNKIVYKFDHSEKDNTNVKHLSKTAYYKSMVTSLASAAKKIKEKPEPEPVEEEVETTTVNEPDGDKGVARYVRDKDERTQPELDKELTQLKAKMRSYPKMAERMGATFGHKNHDKESLAVLVRQAKHALAHPEIYNR